MEEENHGTSDAAPLSMSQGSVIKIDSIYIDLTRSMEKTEAANCEHFSIRGYVAEMRKKDRSICLPFGSDGNNKLEEQASKLPPLHVAKFKWWRCQNCVREVAATSTVAESEIVPRLCESGFTSTSTSSHKQNHVDADMVLSKLEQSKQLNNIKGPNADAITCINANVDSHCLPSCSYEEETNLEVGHSAAKGHENGLEEHLNQELRNSTSDTTNSGPYLLPEGPTDGTGKELVVYCEPNCEVAELVGATDNVGDDSAEMCQTRNLTSADHDQQGHDLMVSEVPDAADENNVARNAVRVQTIRATSLELEECAKASSDDDEVMAENNIQNQQQDSSTGLARRRTRKVRLLTDILGAKANSENDNIKKGEAFSNAMDVSGVAAHPDNQQQLPEDLEMGFVGPSRKRKTTEDKELQQLAMICSNSMNKKVKVDKRGNEITDMKIVNKVSDEDAFAGMGIQTDKRSLRTKHGSNRNAIQGKKKNKEIQVSEGFSKSVPWKNVVSWNIHFENGNTDNNDFPKRANDAFRYGGLQTISKDHPPLPQTERNSVLSKKKNKMPQNEDAQALQQTERNSILSKKKNKTPQNEDAQAPFMPLSDSTPQEGSVSQEMEIMQTGPEGLKLQLAPDTSAAKGMDLSRNNYVDLNETNICYAAENGGGTNLSLPQPNNMSTEELSRMKDGVIVEEASVPPSPSSEERLLSDLNKIIAQKTSVLREMQNRATQAEDRSTLHQKLDIAGAGSNEKAVEVQEPPMVTKKHFGQKVDGENEVPPSDIVELMVNQFGRLHEAERNHPSPDRTQRQKDGDVMNISEVDGNGVSGTPQEPVPHMRKSRPGHGRNGLLTIGENGSQLKLRQLSSSHLRSYQFNVGTVQDNPAYTGSTKSLQSQKKLPREVLLSASDSFKANSPRNCIHRSAPNKLSIFEACDTCQSGMSSEAERVRLSMMRNHGKVGYHFLNEHGTQSETPLELPDRLRKGKLVAPSIPSKMTSMDFQLIGRHTETEVGTKGMHSADLYNNETITAMQLLSLMNAGMKSSSSFGPDRSTKVDKPFIPSDYHLKNSVNERSKFVERTFLPSNTHSKELYAKGNDFSTRQLSAFYNKIGPSDKASEYFPALPAGAAISSKFQEDGKYKGHIDFHSQQRAKGKSPIQFGGQKLHHNSYHFPGKQTENYGAFGSLVESVQPLVVKDSRKRTDLEASGMNESVRPILSIPNTDVCTLNTNPADFTVPGRRNEFMIAGDALWPGKKISSKGRPCSVNVDGRKRQRAMKLPGIKENGQLHTS